MKIASVREVKENLSKYISKMNGKPVVITKNGRPCAGMVELKDEDDVEAFLMANNPRLMKLFDQSLAGGGEMPHEEVAGMVRKSSR